MTEFDLVADSAPDPEYARIQHRRLPDDYERAVRLGRSLLDNELPGLYAGSFTGRGEVLFMPQLFQEFVAATAGEAARSAGFKVQHQQGGRYLAAWRTGPHAPLSAVEVIPDTEVLAGFGPPVVVWKYLAPQRRGMDIDACIRCWPMGAD